MAKYSRICYILPTLFRHPHFTTLHFATILPLSPNVPIQTLGGIENWKNFAPKLAKLFKKPKEPHIQMTKSNGKPTDLCAEIIKKQFLTQKLSRGKTFVPIQRVLVRPVRIDSNSQTNTNSIPQKRIQKS